MEFLQKPNLSPKFRAALTNPTNVIDVEVVSLMDPEYWVENLNAANTKNETNCKKSLISKTTLQDSSTWIAIQSIVL